VLGAALKNLRLHCSFGAVACWQEGMSIAATVSNDRHVVQERHENRVVNRLHFKTPAYWTRWAIYHDFAQAGRCGCGIARRRQARIFVSTKARLDGPCERGTSDEPPTALCGSYIRWYLILSAWCSSARIRMCSAIWRLCDRRRSNSVIPVTLFQVPDEGLDITFHSENFPGGSM